MSLQTFVMHCALAAAIFTLSGKWACNIKRSENAVIVKSFEIGQLLEANKQKDILLALGDNLNASNNRLMEANNELARVFNTIDEVLFSIDMTTSRVTQKSKACESIFGYSSEEFYEDPSLWTKMIHCNDRKILEHIFDNLNEGKIAIGQFRIFHKTKSVRWIEAKLAPTFDENRLLVKIDGTCSDITARTELERKLAAEIKQKQ